jgi:hypothetical protein
VNASKTFATAGDTVDLNISDTYSEEGIIGIVGGFTGTIVVEGAPDGVTYTALAMSPVGGGADVTSTAAAGAWRVNFAGCKTARVRASALSAGTPAVTAQVSRKAA